MKVANSQSVASQLWLWSKHSCTTDWCLIGRTTPVAADIARFLLQRELSACGHDSRAAEPAIPTRKATSDTLSDTQSECSVEWGEGASESGRLPSLRQLVTSRPSQASESTLVPGRTAHPASVYRPFTPAGACCLPRAARLPACGPLTRGGIRVEAALTEYSPRRHWQHL